LKNACAMQRSFKRASDLLSAQTSTRWSCSASVAVSSKGEAVARNCNGNNELDFGVVDPEERCVGAQSSNTRRGQIPRKTPKHESVFQGV